jgi:hypothetical protein
VRYVLVVAIFACPAFVMTAIALDPAAASWMIAVCRRSWNGRIALISTSAALIACSSASLNLFPRYVVPRSGWQKTSSSVPLERGPLIVAR